MIVHIPALLQCLASGYFLDAASGSSAITLRTEFSTFLRISAKTFGIKSCQLPSIFLISSWLAQPGQLPVLFTSPPCLSQVTGPQPCLLVDTPQPPPLPLCPSPRSLSFPFKSSGSDSFCPLLPPLSCFFAWLCPISHHKPVSPQVPRCSSQINWCTLYGLSLFW